MSKLKKSVVITDLDNTLWDWFTIWHSSFSAFLDKVVEISGIPRDDLIAEIRPVHQKYGTAEYAFVLEKLPSIVTKYGSRETINRVFDDAIHIARSRRMDNLKLYQGVYDTLSYLKTQRVRVVAYTESKEWYTKDRLKKLGLDYFIEHLYSPPDHSLPIDEEQRVPIDFKYMKSSHTPENELKPNPALLLDIIKELGVNKDECIYIGDSEVKDVYMAKQAGVTSVFARYGTTHFEHREEDYNLLRAVTHWTDDDVERERQVKLEATQNEYSADYTIDKFADILELFDFEKKKR